MKALIHNLFFVLSIFPLFTGCNNDVTVKGRIMDALDDKPLRKVVLLIEGIANIKTDADGYYKIRRLKPFQNYDIKIQPAGFTSVSFQIRTQDKGQIIEVELLSVIPQPPSPGVFAYRQGTYDRISEKKAFRYDLRYGEPGKVPLGFDGSERGRLAAWFLKDESISSLPQIAQGVPLVVYHMNNNGIAPLYNQESRTITVKSGRSLEQATIPEGWYLGLTDLEISEYNIYSYATVKYTIRKWSFKELQSKTGQGFSIISTNIEPGKYSLINSEMDWNPNITYAIVDGVRQEISESVAVFELIK